MSDQWLPRDADLEDARLTENQPCQCGNPDAGWHGDPTGRREYLCDECWDAKHRPEGYEGDLCVVCGNPIDHNDPHLYCGKCGSRV